jgi:predicted TPR repeat methyltransferase
MDRTLMPQAQSHLSHRNPGDVWRQALVRAGYTQAGRPGPLHVSQLANPAGDRRAAEHAFRALLAACPDDRDGLEGLAFLLQLEGRGDEALPYRRRLFSQHAQRLGVAPDAQAATADYLLSAETGDQSPAAAPVDYVRCLFDRYADDFDGHLRDKLNYRVPELLFDKLAAQLPDKTSSLDILDIGCGTGLAGEVFKPFAGRLDGIDLSPEMLARARRRGIYDRLEAGEIVALLSGWAVRYNTVIAADVLGYLGELQPVFDGVSKVLYQYGFFVFSVEQGDGADYRLRASGRYQHTAGYLRRCAQNAGFEVLSLGEAVLREQHGQPVAGHLVVMRRN